AKRSRQLLDQLSCLGSAANAPPRPKGWPKLWLTLLHHSPTPLLGPLPRHLNSRVRNRIRSLSLAPCILLAKFSLISVANRLPSKNARIKPKNNHEEHRGHEDLSGLAFPSCSS